MNNNIQKLKFYNIINSMNFMFPVLIVFYQWNGLSLTQIALLTSIAAASTLLLEVPSGIFADFKGKKYALIIASIAGLLSYIMLSIGSQYWMFIIAAVLLGTQNAFKSGADTALLYDSLKQKSHFKKVRGDIFAYGMWAFAIATLIGGYLASIEMRIPLFICILSSTVNIIVSFSFKEIYRDGKGEKVHKHIGESFSLCMKDFVILSLTIYITVIIGVLDGTYRFFQAYFADIGIPLAYFGVIYMLSLIGTGIFGKIAYKLENKIGIRKSIIGIAVLFVLSLLLLGYKSAWVVLLVFFVLEWIYGFVIPLIEDYTNKRIASNKRATMLSIQSFAKSVFIIIMIPLFGFAMDISIPYAFLFMGIVCLIALFVPTIILVKEYRT